MCSSIPKCMCASLSVHVLDWDDLLFHEHFFDKGNVFAAPSVLAPHLPALHVNVIPCHPVVCFDDTRKIVRIGCVVPAMTIFFKLEDRLPSMALSPFP